jgi:hypothetical protein
MFLRHRSDKGANGLDYGCTLVISTEPQGERLGMSEIQLVGKDSY